MRCTGNRAPLYRFQIEVKFYLFFMPSLFQKPVPFRIISDYGFIVINSAFLIMGTNQMVIFDALTLAVFKKDFEEFSDTCAHI